MSRYDVLYERYSGILSRNVPFQCEEGWFIIIETALKILSSYNLQITQIKEKFGGLRIYYICEGDSYEVIDSVILFAEYLSHQVCEKCGSMNSVESKSFGGWMKTLCKECQGE